MQNAGQANYAKKEFFFLAEFSVKKICSYMSKEIYQLLTEYSSPTA
jgi:hypothetical protein